MAYVFFWMILTTCLCFAYGDIACSHTDGLEMCTSLQKCPTMLEVVTRAKQSNQDLELVKQSICGFEGTTPKVCCPVPCLTPEGLEGSCLNLSSCPPLAKLMEHPLSKQDLHYIRESKCSSSHEYGVCCPPHESRSSRFCSKTDSVFPPDPESGCCGFTSFTPDVIVSGSAAKTQIDEYPWMVIVGYPNATVVNCVGALISSRYVITAAQCVVEPHVAGVGMPNKVLLGEYDTGSDSADCIEVAGGGLDCTEGAIQIGIQKIIPHPDFDTASFQSPNDIALIKLISNAPYTDFIRPICLPSTDITTKLTDRLTLFAAGWGESSPSGEFSKVRLQVGLPYVAKEQCEMGYKSIGINVSLTDGQLCAGGVPGKDTCKGDTGGPLMNEKIPIYEIVGVVSFSATPCGQRNVPGVYTKVYEYLPWIWRTINIDETFKS